MKLSGFVAVRRDKLLAVHHKRQSGRIGYGTNAQK